MPSVHICCLKLCIIILVKKEYLWCHWGFLKIIKPVYMQKHTTVGAKKGEKEANYVSEKGVSLEGSLLERWVGSSKPVQWAQGLWVGEDVDATWLQESYAWLWNQRFRWIWSVFCVFVDSLWLWPQGTVPIRGFRLSHWVVLRLGCWPRQPMLSVLCPPLRTQLPTGIS